MTQKKSSLDSFGYCHRCGVTHTLGSESARKKGVELIKTLEARKNIGFSDDTPQTSLLSTAPLFGEQRGKMFGVLKCLDSSGSSVWLYSFSGQFNGQWWVQGWAPPLFDLDRFKTVHDPVEKQIKALGETLAKTANGSEKYQALTQQRKLLSRQLMTDIHDLYQLNNFAGERAALHKAFMMAGGKPTGTGDCCAPKLLNSAALQGLLPISLAEFFFGRTNRSHSKKHGEFYAPCKEKCQPLLGFLLCGIEQRKDDFAQ